jgi:hypothetical protein
VALALASFNIGVELGQLAVVALLAPVILAVRRTHINASRLKVVGSALVVACGAFWFIERIM